MKMLTLALAAGGTGGHMFPAEALAETAKERSWRVILLTDARGMRYAERFPADEIVLLDAANPNVKGIFGKVSAGLTLLGGIRTARRMLKRHRADAAVGFGGYPSAPGLFAAGSLGLPFGVHEQNAVLGRVNRRAAPRAAFVAHGFERLDHLPAERQGVLVRTGNPVRRAVLNAARDAFEAPGEDDPLRVLIFGGSQGASLFARVFPAALAGLPDPLRRRLRVTHQVIDADREAARAAYAEAGIAAELAPFFADLPDRIAAAHYIVSRAGASTVSELGAIGRPALLVPLGIAMDDHQRVNAETLVDAGAADVIMERDLDRERAREVIAARLSDPVWLSQAAAAAKGRMPTNAAAAVADLVEAAVDRRSGETP